MNNAVQTCSFSSFIFAIFLSEFKSEYMKIFFTQWDDEQINVIFSWIDLFRKISQT
jgi:hypothetical protein